MDLVVRGRSRECQGNRTKPEADQDRCGARQDRTRGRGRTGAEPGRTGPEGVGGPVRSQAGQDQRAWREIWAEEHLSTAAHQREPEGEDRVAATKAKPSRASQPVIRGEVCSRCFECNARRWFVYWVEVTIKKNQDFALNLLYFKYCVEQFFLHSFSSLFQEILVKCFVSRSPPGCEMTCVSWWSFCCRESLGSVLTRNILLEFPAVGSSFLNACQRRSIVVCRSS